MFLKKAETLVSSKELVKKLKVPAGNTPDEVVIPMIECSDSVWSLHVHYNGIRHRACMCSLYNVQWRVKKFIVQHYPDDMDQWRIWLSQNKR